jgi:hypothetical protein
MAHETVRLAEYAVGLRYDRRMFGGSAHSPAGNV